MSTKRRGVQALLQPHLSSMCGQVCVAMAVGCSLEEAAAAVGRSVLRDEGTHETDLIRALKKLGMKVGAFVDLCPRKGRTKKLILLPKFAIMGIGDRKTRWGHWVLLRDGVVYDPGIGYPLPVHIYELFIIERAYSRRYPKGRHAHKRVRALWVDYIPILGKKP